MEKKRPVIRRQHPKPVRLLANAIVSLAWLTATLAAVPALAIDVDGLLAPDAADYQIISEDPGRGAFYWGRDGNLVYLLVRVDPAVNDNVFGSRRDDAIYLQSAGWLDQHRFRELEKSDLLELNLSCGAHSWTWTLDYCYDLDRDYDPAEQDWASGIGGPDGSGTPPPSFTSSSSLAWNLNNTTWDMSLGGARSGIDGFKSPDPRQNYPNFDPQQPWEWSMIYEMGMDLSICGCEPISINTGRSHNSPAKSGDPNIFFPAATVDTVLAIASPDADACLGLPAKLDATGSINLDCPSGLLYEWREGSTVVRPASPDPTFVPPTDTLGTHTYTVVVSCPDLAPCDAADEVVVTVRPCALSVRFDWYTASRNPHGDGTVISWRTLSETGTLGFIIERTDGVDGQFVALDGWVDATGDGSTYGFRDPITASPATWYRIVEFTAKGADDRSPPFRLSSGASGERKRGDRRR